MDLQPLTNYFSVKLELTQGSLRFLEGNSNVIETISTINSNVLLLNQMKQKLEELKQVVKEWKHRVTQANLCLKYIRENTFQFRNLLDDLPSRLPCNLSKENIRKTTNTVTTDNATENNLKEVKTKSNSGGKNGEIREGPSKGDVAKKPLQIPFISILTMQEFDAIPKYMKGRLQYEGINSAIDEFNAVISDKYQFLRKGFQAMASIGEKKRFKEMKCLENKETKGAYFIVADDLRSASTLKTEGQRRNIFSILRHFRRIREIRAPGQILRYAIV